MNKTRMTFYKYISCFLCLCFIVTLLPVSVSAKETKSKTIKVGWYEDSYNITGKNGERSGYGDEYQQSVAAYTGWKYQYVEAGWSDLLVMIEKGKILSVCRFKAYEYFGFRLQDFKWKTSRSFKRKYSGKSVL